MNRQSGMATLLVSSMLLVVALLLTMAFSTSSMHQMKRAQNEITRAQQKWFAEGGLECALSVSYQDENIFDTPSVIFDECTKNSDIDGSILSVAASQLSGKTTYHEVKSSITGGVKLYRQYQKRTIDSPAAIEASSDLFMRGSISVRPGTEEKSMQPDGLYKCVSIKFKNKLDVDGNLSTSNLHKPFENFNTSIGGACSTEPEPGYITSANSFTFKAPEPGETLTRPSNVGLDVSLDTNLDPFYRRFDIERSEWESVRDDPKEFTKIINHPANCDASLASALAQGHHRIWIEGTCDLGSAALSGPKLKDNKEAKLIVIANGYFSARTSLNMYGTLYHFYANPIVADPNRVLDWEALSNGPYLTEFGQLTGGDLQRLIYVTTGSFFPTGGYVMDAPNGVAALATSNFIQFDFNAMAQPAHKTNWVKGSWRDYD